MPAELLEDTIADDLEATSLPEEEAAPDEAVETEVEAENANPYEGLSKEQIEELIESARKDAEAKARKSEADKAAAAAAEQERQRQLEQFNRDRQAASSLLNGNAYRAIADGIGQYMKAAIKAANEGEEAPEVNAQWIQNIVAGMQSGLRNLETEEWSSSANGWFKANLPEFEPPRDLVVQAAQAQSVYGKKGWLEAVLSMARAAGIEEGKQQGRQSRDEDDRVKALESKNGRQPAPTSASPTAPVRRDPLTALASAPITSEEADRRAWAEAYPGVPYPVR